VSLEELLMDQPTPQQIRDLFAAHALTGMLANAKSTDPAAIAGASEAWGAQGAVFAMRAYEYADAMMAARQSDKDRRKPQ
jgi:hypothetical protein